MKLDNTHAAMLKIETVLALAAKTSDGLDRVMSVLHDWSPQELTVLFAAGLRALAEVHPETRELVISQIGLVFHRIETDGRAGN